MTGDQIAGIVRAVLAALGGYFVAKGVTDAATVTTISVPLPRWRLLSGRCFPKPAAA
jgi:hypothetical protein